MLSSSSTPIDEPAGQLVEFGCAVISVCNALAFCSVRGVDIGCASQNGVCMLIGLSMAIDALGMRGKSGYACCTIENGL
jgi:hypothetical protein